MKVVSIKYSLWVHIKYVKTVQSHYKRYKHWCNVYTTDNIYKTDIHLQRQCEKYIVKEYSVTCSHISLL